MARLETNIAKVGLEAIFLQVSSVVAQLTDPDEGTGLDSMSFVHAPGALVIELFVSPVPWTVNSFLDSSDVAGIERGSGWSEGMSDVLAKAAVGVRPGKVASGLA